MNKVSSMKRLIRYIFQKNKGKMADWTLRMRK